MEARSTAPADFAALSDFGSPIHRPNKVEVDLGAIRDNTRIVKGLLGPGTTLLGAVKCNGYGLGLPAVAEAMLAGGADGFTLSDPADAVSIRRAGIRAPIVFYGGILPSPEAAAALQRLDLACTVTDEDTGRAFGVANTSPEPLSVFAKIDVGMERLGTYPEGGCDSSGPWHSCRGSSWRESTHIFMAVSRRHTGTGNWTGSRCCCMNCRRRASMSRSG